MHGPAATPTQRPSGPAPAPAPRDALAYSIDVWQRSMLFWDTLRERANYVLDRESSGAPDVLAFRHETLLDARRFDRPVNYALLRITAYGSDEADHCLDPDKPPLIVMDPRAGSGPGIGGFRRESELGIALHERYLVYFASFFPEPYPSQTLIDVLHALRHFADEVIRRHPGKLPILYGNRRAGWAAILLALHCKGALGPVVLNGSPLSYWSGEPGVNPMRLAGGLTGGIWPVRLLADLGDGRFDGAWLVNFEMLKPEVTLWEKYSTPFRDHKAEIALIRLLVPDQVQRHARWHARGRCQHGVHVPPLMHRSVVNRAEVLGLRQAVEELIDAQLLDAAQRIAPQQGDAVMCLQELLHVIALGGAVALQGLGDGRDERIPGLHQFRPAQQFHQCTRLLQPRGHALRVVEQREQADLALREIGVQEVAQQQVGRDLARVEVDGLL